jgi:hypothetical protein
MFFNWFRYAADNKHPRIAVRALRAAQNFFVSMAAHGQVGTLNSFFVGTVELCISKTLNMDLLQGGFSSMTSDAVNDISQHCDNEGLRQSLQELCDHLLTMMDELAQRGTYTGNQYSEEHIEQLVNNFGGLLQVLVVRIGREHMPQELIQKTFNTLSSVCARDSCRQGAILMLNGVLNTIDQDWLQQIQETVINLIESTIKDEGQNGQPYAFDVFCKRGATGLIVDLANSMQAHIVPYLPRIVELLFIVLQDGNIQTQVKTFGIGAVGDICLVTEHAFRPYFNKTMEILIGAGQVCLQHIDQTLPPEEQ